MSKLCAITCLKPVLCWLFRGCPVCRVKSDFYLPSASMLDGEEKEQLIISIKQRCRFVLEQCYGIQYGWSPCWHRCCILYLFLSLDSREEYCSFFAESGLCPFEEECRYLTAKNTDQRGSFSSRLCVFILLLNSWFCFLSMASKSSGRKRSKEVQVLCASLVTRWWGGCHGDVNHCQRCLLFHLTQVQHFQLEYNKCVGFGQNICPNKYIL